MAERTVEELEDQLKKYLKEIRERKVPALQKRENKLNSNNKVVQKVVQKSSSNLNYYYKQILESINDGLIPKQITRKLSWSKTKLHYHTNKLIEQGLITKSGHGVSTIWELTQKGNLYLHNKDPNFSIGKVASQSSISIESSSNIKKPKDYKVIDVHVHALRIKFDLINDGSSDFWVRNSDMVYYKKYYRYEKEFTIEKTSKSIIIHIDFHISLNDPKLFEDDFGDKLLSKINRSVEFLDLNKIEIDKTKPMDINVEYAIETPLTRELRKFTGLSSEYLDLNRLREKLFKEGLDQEAYAKFDGSHKKSLETVDRLYVRKILEMPEVIDGLDKKLTPAIDKLTEQINLHLEVQKETKNLSISQSEVLKKMNDTLSQISTVFRKEQKISNIIRDLEHPKVKEKSYIECVCPFCKASMSSRLLLERDFICPSCSKPLNLYFPNLK